MFVGCMFLGIGIGFLTGELPAGTLIWYGNRIYTSKIS